MTVVNAGRPPLHPPSLSAHLSASYVQRVRGFSARTFVPSVCFVATGYLGDENWMTVECPSGTHCHRLRYWASEKTTAAHQPI